MKKRCSIDDIHITFRVVSYDDYRVDDEGRLVELRGEAMQEMDALALPYYCRAYHVEFATWKEVKQHLAQPKQGTTL